MTEDSVEIFSPPLRIEGRGGEITDLVSWFECAKPAGGEKQWKDGRSAKEIARAWSGSAPGAPADFIALLNGATGTRGIKIGLVVPEARLRLDEHRGNTRNADLLVHGRARGRTVLITVEAKADEAFGTTIGKAVESSPKNSKRPDRIKRLCELIFGVTHVSGRAELEHLRYQLLHGFGATVMEARAKKAETAVFVVHKFLAAGEDELSKRRVANDADFKAFFRAVNGGEAPSGSLFKCRLPSLRGKLPSKVLAGGILTQL